MDYNIKIESKKLIKLYHYNTKKTTKNFNCDHDLQIKIHFFLRTDNTKKSTSAPEQNERNT
jgi:hypothetical protein